MFPTRAQSGVVLLLLALTGCGRHASRPTKTPAPAASDAGFIAPPSVTSVSRSAAGLVLVGAAPAGAQVRLATPAGEARLATADAAGQWSLTLPALGEPRIYGLSETRDGATVQAQGYVLVTPGAGAAMLRAGAGAVRLDRTARSRIAAFDFDQGGGAVVSGVAPAGAPLSVRLDGRQAADGQAGADGRYAIALPPDRPLTRGPHRIEVVGDGVSAAIETSIGPPAPLVGGPMRSQLSPAGLRVDWLTPGGGVQSTLLVG